MPTIDDLITDINQGQLRLPEFQRGYVWTRDQAREFVVSLYRGHPTGHLLIWHAYGPVKTRGGSGEGKGTTLLLLDGQQRLTTLYALIKGTPPRSTTKRSSSLTFTSASFARTFTTTRKL